MKYIYHHLGLGDHFICNGLVRYLYDLNENTELQLFCKSRFKNNIEFMYRNLTNLNILHLPNDEDVLRYIQENNLQKNTIVIGFDNIRCRNFESNTFDQQFYESQNVPFHHRFSDFFILRDKLREQKLFDDIIKTDRYIFVHDDSSRGMNIDESRINNTLPIIRNDNKNLITDYLTILENAEEIHVMQSCFKDMINSYKMPKPKLFLHNYVRNYDAYANTKGLNHFEVVY